MGINHAVGLRDIADFSSLGIDPITVEMVELPLPISPPAIDVVVADEAEGRVPSGLQMVPFEFVIELWLVVDRKGNLAERAVVGEVECDNKEQDAKGVKKTHVKQGC